MKKEIPGSRDITSQAPTVADVALTSEVVEMGLVMGLKMPCGMLVVVVVHGVCIFPKAEAVGLDFERLTRTNDRRDRPRSSNTGLAVNG